ncbi:MAG: molybdate ABC transporter permease subunit [Moraxellaceae bacterium]|nr:MAG: molybdate ABC transporter permease subunit [Moraxellaceae bacterium]
MLSTQDIQALWLTVQLATLTTVLLLLLTMPLAWWLARQNSRLAVIVESIVTLPLILPPTVLGFYFLIAFSPEGILGSPWVTLTGEPLSFSFAGLVVGSMIYSMPFVVQPLQNAFRQLDLKYLETASTMGAGPQDQFFSIVIPLCRTGFISAATMGFAHTVGEFGIILMIGGNIPGQTQVASLVLFDHVEALNYSSAHLISAILMVSSLVMLIFINTLNRNAMARSQ